MDIFHQKKKANGTVLRIKYTISARNNCTTARNQPDSNSKRFFLKRKSENILCVDQVPCDRLQKRSEYSFKTKIHNKLASLKKYFKCIDLWFIWRKRQTDFKTMNIYHLFRSQIFPTFWKFFTNQFLMIWNQHWHLFDQF